MRLLSRIRRLLPFVQLARISAGRWIDAFWGYDVFIAHRRADAAAYAIALFNKLTAERIATFIDREVYGPGDSLLIATRRHVAKSTLFLLVGSPEILSTRKPMDWVEREIDTYLSTHAADPKLILVDFGGTIETALASPFADANPILRQLAPFLRLRERISALSQVPSEAVLHAVRRELKGRRRDRNRLRFFQGTAAVLALLLLAAVALGVFASVAQQRAVLEARTALSRQAAAQASIGTIRADLRLLLAMAALRTSPTIEARRSLLSALWINPLPYYYLRTGEHEDIEGLDFSPDERQLKAISSDGTLFVWDIAERMLVSRRRLPVKNVTTFAYDRMTVRGAVASVPLGRGSPEAWMIDSQMRLTKLGIPQGIRSIRGMRFSSDGRYLGATSPPNGVVILWDTLSPAAPYIEPCPGAATAVAFSGDPGLFATSCDDGIRVWSLRNGVARSAYTIGRTRLFNVDKASGSQEEVSMTAPVFAEKDKEIVAGVGSSVVLWNARGRRPIIALLGHSDDVTAIAASPDGIHVVAGGIDGLVLVWNKDHSDPYQILVGHNTAVSGITYSPSGRWLASYGDDGTILLWNTSGAMPTASVLHGPWSGASGITAFGDGDRVAFLDSNDVLYVSREGLTDPRKVATLKEFNSDLSISRDGSVLAYVTQQGRVALVDPTSGITKLLPSNNDVSHVAVSPNGEYLALVESRRPLDRGDTTISIVRRASGEQLSAATTAHTGEVSMLIFSPDGHSLASRVDDRLIDVWKIPSLGPPHQFSIDSGIVLSLAFSPTTPVLASGDSNGDVQLWNLRSGSKDGEALRGHNGRPVFALGFSADGTTLASGGGDLGVVLWDVHSRQPLSPILRGHSGILDGVLFRNGGQNLLSWADDKKVISWDLNIERWKAQACATANRSISEAEWRQYIGQELSSYQVLCPATRFRP